MHIEKTNMRVYFRDALELDRVRIVVWAILPADQYVRHVRPCFAQQLEPEVVHIDGLAVESMPPKHRVLPTIAVSNFNAGAGSSWL